MTQTSALTNWLVSSVQRVTHNESSSVGKWLEDIRTMTETECMCVLQGKTLTNNSPSDQMLAAAKTAKESISAVKGRAHIISAEFSKLFKKLEKERWKQVRSGVLRVACHIRSLLHECNSSIHNPPRDFLDQQEQLMTGCAKLVQYVENTGDTNGHAPKKQPLGQYLTYLGQSFSQLVDLALGQLVQGIITRMMESHSDYTLKSSINHLISLGLEGEHMCYIIAREGGIGAFFDLCRSGMGEVVQASALRAIATTCCVTESILELEKSGGVSCLSDLMCDPRSTEMVRAEAAGVIAQITSPSLDHYQHIAGFIENMEDIIRALTILCSQTSNHEVFLLGAAALANITFMDTLACDYLLQYNTTRVLIQACTMINTESLFAKDQVATVLANMAALENCSSEITENKGVELLVHFLKERPSSYKSDAEIAACERVQQKAAIALTRLCRDPGNAPLIVEVHGVPNLVSLCRNLKERNNSDAVLVACLAAIRKVSSICGYKGFNHMDIQQLLKPKLLDSFLMCSHMEECFV